MTTLEKLKRYCRKDLSPVEQLAIQQEIDIIVIPRLIAALEWVEERRCELKPRLTTESSFGSGMDHGEFDTLSCILNKLEGEK